MNNAGIYAIKNISNGKMYIGSSNDFDARFTKHKSRLNHNQMGSKELQDDWNNAADKSIFQLETIEIIDNPTKKELFEREQFYLDLFKSQGQICYNHCETVSGGNGSGELHPFYGREVPEETREKISDTLSGRKLSKDHRKNIGQSQIGHKRITREIAEKIAQQNRKLTNEQVLQILSRIKNKEKLSTIHKNFSEIISYSTLKAIKRGDGYSHISRT